MKRERTVNILLVEDNPFDVELALDAFREANFKNSVQVCWSGEQALDYLHGRNEYGNRELHPPADIVVLDLKLPGIDGHEVLQEIKSTPGLKLVPVIVLTSSRDWHDQELSSAGGADEYLEKPAIYDEFLHIVERIGLFALKLDVDHTRQG